MKPTVAAYQTEVADLEATVEALQTQVTELRDRIRGQRETPTPEPGQDGDLYEIGETFTVDPWEITVTGWELSPTLSTNYETNTARGIYALVYFTVTNVGDAPTDFPYDALALKTGEGRTYDVDDDALFNLQYTIYGLSRYDELQPGLPYETAVLFDIPPDSTQLVLTSEGDEFTISLS
jgi:hypothetical protein